MAGHQAATGAAAAVVTGGPHGGAATDTAGVQQHTLTELDSGIRVVTESVPSVRSIAIGLWVRVGSRDEGETESGISHFLEHLLFKGTPRLTAEQIAQVFDGFGADVNAATSKETTVLYAHFLDEHLEDALEVMADMLLRSTYADMDSEREVVLEEIAMYEDEPSDKVHDVLSAAIFGDHPLGRPVIGRRDVISSLTLDEVSAYHANRYAPSSIVLAAAGNLEHGDIERLAQAHLDGDAGPIPARGHDAPERHVGTAAFQEKDTEQYHICLGGPGIQRDDERRFALSVLDAVLGGATSSRLFQEVREKRGLAYSVYSWASHYRDTGQLGIYVGTRGDNVAAAMDVIGAELRRLQREPMGEDELARAREHVKGRIVLSMESTASRMHRLGRSVLTDTPLLSIDEVLARLDAVGRDDVDELAHEFYAPEALSAAAIGREEPVFRAALGSVSSELAAAA
jgi:predicted Zn-dependent peptidase